MVDRREDNCSVDNTNLQAAVDELTERTKSRKWAASLSECSVLNIGITRYNCNIITISYTFNMQVQLEAVNGIPLSVTIYQQHYIEVLHVNSTHGSFASRDTTQQNI